MEFLHGFEIKAMKETEIKQSRVSSSMNTAVHYAVAKGNCQTCLKIRTLITSYYSWRVHILCLRALIKTTGQWLVVVLESSICSGGKVQFKEDNCF